MKDFESQVTLAANAPASLDLKNKSAFRGMESADDVVPWLMLSQTGGAQQHLVEGF